MLTHAGKATSFRPARSAWYGIERRREFSTFLPGASIVASHHESNAVDERGGSGRGRTRAMRWIQRVTALSLGVTVASGSLASYAANLARAQTAGPSRSTAPAGSTSDPTAIQRADAAFKEGRAFFDLGRYEQACEKFELSMQLDPSPGTLLNLGNCYEPQGDLLRALENFERAFAFAERTSDPRRKELWMEAARERIASLSRRVPWLSVRNVPPDGQLSLDQQLLERESQGRTSGVLRVNPGRHWVEVSAPGKRTFRQEFDIATGQRLAIDIPALESRKDVPGTADPFENDFDHSSQEGTPDRHQYGLWPYVLGGAGTLLLATSVGTWLAANAKENKLENECFGTTCPLELEGTRQSAKTLATMTDIFWITGLISAGLGVTLFVLDSQDDATSTSVEASCFGSGCG
jgi:hypothetical protein